MDPCRSESVDAIGRRRLALLLAPLFLAAGTGLALGAALLYRVDPAGSMLYPRCMLHELTGLHCPGCGTTRALHQLLHGHWREAVRLNPLAFLVLLYLGYVAAGRAAQRLGGRPWPRPFATARSVWVLTAFLLLYTVLRNLPWEPFRSLAP